MFENYSSLNGRFLQRALGFTTPLCRETICPTSAIQFYSFANDTVFYFSVNNTFLFTMNNYSFHFSVDGHFIMNF